MPEPGNKRNRASRAPTNKAARQRLVRKPAPRARVLLRDNLEDKLAAQVWPAPEFSALFRIKAGYLIAARAEDQLVLPTGPLDPLAAQLAQMVYADLRADGLPVR